MCCHDGLLNAVCAAFDHTFLHELHKLVVLLFNRLFQRSISSNVTYFQNFIHQWTNQFLLIGEQTGHFADIIDSICQLNYQFTQVAETECIDMDVPN